MPVAHLHCGPSGISSEDGGYANSRKPLMVLFQGTHLQLLCIPLQLGRRFGHEVQVPKQRAQTGCSIGMPRLFVMSHRAAFLLPGV